MFYDVEILLPFFFFFINSAFSAEVSPWAELWVAEVAHFQAALNARHPVLLILRARARL